MSNTTRAWLICSLPWLVERLAFGSEDGGRKKVGLAGWEGRLLSFCFLFPFLLFSWWMLCHLPVRLSQDAWFLSYFSSH